MLRHDGTTACVEVCFGHLEYIPSDSAKIDHEQLYLPLFLIKLFINQ